MAAPFVERRNGQPNPSGLSFVPSGRLVAEAEVFKPHRGPDKKVIKNPYVEQALARVEALSRGEITSQEYLDRSRSLDQLRRSKPVPAQEAIVPVPPTSAPTEVF